MNVFKRLYLQIVLILVSSTLMLLILVGGLVYLGLRVQLKQDGQASLQSEVLEVEDAIRSLSVLPTQTVTKLQFSDDKGQNAFFIVSYQGETTLTSSTLPVSLAALPKVGKSGFAIFSYDDNLYRVLQENWSFQGHVYQIYVYRLALQEFAALDHARDVLIGGGLLGLFAAMTFDLWLAFRALRPARQTWAEHQQMLAELSHELQTPLATMSAIVAGAGHLDVNVGQELQREISHASGMVQDILFLSRLRASSIPRRGGEPVAVSDITEEVADRFTALANRREIALQGLAHPGLFVKTTNDAWSRLVSTLLKNVVDHAASPSSATWRLSATGHQVVFVVTNALAPHAPQPPGDGDLTHGFGLSIARRLAEDMNGTFRMRAQGQKVVTEVTVPRLTV